MLKAIGYSRRGSCSASCSSSRSLIAAIGGALGLWLAQRRHQAGPDAGADPALPSDDRARRRGASSRSARAARRPAAGAQRDAAERGHRAAEGLTVALPARLQPAQREGAVDVVARGDHRDRRHGRRVHRDAGARARVSGDAGLVGPAAERHRAAGGRRFRDDERDRARCRAHGRGSRRRWRGAGRTRWSAPEVVVIANVPLRGTTAMPTCRCVACRRGCSPCGTTCTSRQGRFFTPGLYEIVVGKTRGARRTRASISGAAVRIGPGTWKVVGVFDAGGSAFDSEIWADADVAQRQLPAAATASSSR